jgi:hypothetical protein
MFDKNVYLNKTKQPFYNLLKCLLVKDNLRQNSKKKFNNLTWVMQISYIVLQKKLS